MLQLWLLCSTCTYEGSQFLSDYESGNWGRFRQFAEKLNEIGREKGYFHFKAEGNEIKDEFQTEGDFLS